VRLDQVRVLAHPLRVRLFELFARQPRTTRQAATALGLPPTRLYHHVAALERAGLLELRETRPNRGTVEKYFGTAKPSLEPKGGTRAVGAEELRRLSRASGEILALGALLLDRAREDCLAALAAHETGAGKTPPPALARLAFSFTPARLVRAEEEVKRFLERLAPLGVPADGESKRWTLTLALVPADDRAGVEDRAAPRPRSRPRRGSKLR
jgi:DNA-binding transcriptional ArsR family regulator